MLKYSVSLIVGRIEMVHFDACVLSRESPVNGRSGLVSFCLQDRDLATESLFIGDTPVHDSLGQDAELDLCHVEPTAGFGSVVKLQPLRCASRPPILSNTISNGAALT